jgi:mannonate dehydratase
MTEERRRELVKQAKKMGEDTKVAVRNHRREAMDVIKKMKTAKELSEDEAAGCEADVEKTIEEFAKKIFFVHFRNTTGSLPKFRETFHDNGDLDMAKLLRLYVKLGIDVPIRVDHVPTLKGESTEVAGYAAMGRLFAIGYLKGLLEAIRGK